MVENQELLNTYRSHGSLLSNLWDPEELRKTNSQASLSRPGSAVSSASRLSAAFHPPTDLGDPNRYWRFPISAKTEVAVREWRHLKEAQILEEPAVVSSEAALEPVAPVVGEPAAAIKKDARPVSAPPRQQQRARPESAQSTASRKSVTK